MEGADIFGNKIKVNLKEGSPPKSPRQINKKQQQDTKDSSPSCNSPKPSFEPSCEASNQQQGSSNGFRGRRRNRRNRKNSSSKREQTPDTDANEPQQSPKHSNNKGI